MLRAFSDNVSDNIKNRPERHAQGGISPCYHLNSEGFPPLSAGAALRRCRSPLTVGSAAAYWDGGPLGRKTPGLPSASSSWKLPPAVSSLCFGWMRTPPHRRLLIIIANYSRFYPFVKRECRGSRLPFLLPAEGFVIFTKISSYQILNAAGKKHTSKSATSWRTFSIFVLHHSTDSGIIWTRDTLKGKRPSR